MDPWLTNEVKELIFAPCLNVSASVGRRLDNRRNMGQEIDERALTEFLVDSLDTSSSENVWGNVLSVLRDHNIYLRAQVEKSTRESKTGADLGFVIHRSVHRSESSSHARYAVLVQCKRIDSHGQIADFFHEVRRSSTKQSTLMLDITPNSYYFIFTPPSLVPAYRSDEPIVFVQARPGCSSAVWNAGSFGFDPISLSPLGVREKAEALGILVVPALAVEAQKNAGKGADLASVLPNCLPFWYWFGELLIPGFVGDRRSDVVEVASNAAGRDNVPDSRFSVRYSVNVSISSE